MAWISVQEQLEAKEEMLAYGPSHSTETEDSYISEIMTYWTRQQQYFSLWPIYVFSIYTKYSWTAESSTESVSSPLSRLPCLLFLYTESVQVMELFFLDVWEADVDTKHLLHIFKCNH